MLAAAAVSECTMSFFSSAEFVCAIKIKKRQLGFSFFFFVREKKNAEKSSHQRKKEAAIKNEWRNKKKKQVLLDAPSPHHPMPEQERRVFFFFFLLFPNELKLCFGFFFFLWLYLCFQLSCFSPFLKNCFVLTKVRLKRFDEHTHKKKKTRRYRCQIFYRKIERRKKVRASKTLVALRWKQRR